MKPSVQKKLGKAKDKRASLQAMQYRNSVKEQLRNERLHILRQPTRTVGMRIENLLARLEAGQITEEELAAHGVNIVIYANQLTRSAFPAMQQTAEEILRYHRAQEVDTRLMPIKDIIQLIDAL